MLQPGSTREIYLKYGLHKNCLPHFDNAYIRVSNGQLYSVTERLAFVLRAVRRTAVSFNTWHLRPGGLETLIAIFERIIPDPARNLQDYDMRTSFMYLFF